MVMYKTFYMDGIIVVDGKDTELCDAAMIRRWGLGVVCVQLVCCS